MIKNLSTNKLISSFQKHDQNICSEHYKASIDKCYHENKLQLTPLRKKVLEILFRDHKPLGAYEVLDILSKEGFSSSPPIAYRILYFLIEKGLVHKTQGLNLFIACAYAGYAHIPAFLICQKCDNVAENKGQKNFSKAPPVALDFKIKNAMIEILGICSTCSNEGVA